MKKILLSFIMLVAAFGIVRADEPIAGIIATYDGAETSYKLEDMPTIVYETVQGVQHAVLYLQGESDPVLSVALADGKSLVIVYGEYVPTPTGLDETTAHISEENGKKIIRGGQLVIIRKDGKMFNAAGMEISK